MLEEVHIWSPERQKRWSKIRTKGMLPYVMKMVGVVFVLSLVIAGIYVAATWGSDKEFPWETMLGIPFFGVLSGLIIAVATWSASEESFKRMRDGPL